MSRSQLRDLPPAYAAELWDRTQNAWGLPGQRCSPYYELQICIPDARPGLKDRYRRAATRHNVPVMAYIAGSGAPCDAGFDLFVPETFVAQAGDYGIVVDHHVNMAMYRVDPGEAGVQTSLEGGRLTLDPGNSAARKPVSFPLYLRSSVAAKTPLRLANGVGVIDAGYRGSLKAVVDVWPGAGQKTVEEGTRIVQVCGPNMGLPVYARLVEKLDDTARGKGGLGSTGQ